MLTIPEITIQRTIESILGYILVNWNANADKSKTALYKLLNGISYGQGASTYDFYVQAQEVFLKAYGQQRKIEVYPSFQTQLSGIPTIYINLPSESADGFNGIGLDQGLGEITFGEEEYTINFTRSFSSTYNIVITSDNRNEVILIYHVLRALLIPALNHVQLSCLENPKLSGRDLQIYENIVPKNLFMRAISLSFTYQVTVDDLNVQQMIENINFTPVAYDLDNSDSI